MLTAKDVQELLQVDRSTIYRMAEAGRIPAIKVGKQWRFPSGQIENWMGMGGGSTSLSTAVSPPAGPEKGNDLASLLPLECVQLIQESHAELLGVMLVITDMQGNPITEVSNPCGLFTAISEVPGAVQRCIQSWHRLGAAINLEPRFYKSHLGLLCARGLIRVNTELKGMVVAGCVAPDEWPPSDGEVEKMADDLSVEPGLLQPHLHEVYVLDEGERTAVLSSVQRIANIVAHIINERQLLLGRLEAIADLTRL